MSIRFFATGCPFYQRELRVSPGNAPRIAVFSDLTLMYIHTYTHICMSVGSLGAVLSLVARDTSPTCWWLQPTLETNQLVADNVRTKRESSILAPAHFSGLLHFCAYLSSLSDNFRARF